MNWTIPLKNRLYASSLGISLLKQTQALQYRYQYAKHYRAKEPSVSLRELNLEFCSACNLRCSFCALDHLKPRELMSLEVLDRVVDQLLNDRRFKGVERLNLHNGGETLLHPKRLELFERLAEHKLRFKAAGRRFPKIVLLTNGMLLRQKLASELLHLEILDAVGFSLDGGSPAAFEELRVNAKWDAFAENVSNFTTLCKAHPKPPKTFGICIVPKPNPLNTSWMHPDFRKVIGALDQVELRRLHDWGGEVEIGESTRVNKIGCSLIMRQMVILPSGEVTVCCGDLNKKGLVGHVLKQSLYDIYAGEERRRYLRYLREGKKDQLPLCKDCVSF